MEPSSNSLQSINSTQNIPTPVKTENTSQPLVSIESPSVHIPKPIEKASLTLPPNAAETALETIETVSDYGLQTSTVTTSRLLLNAMDTMMPQSDVQQQPIENDQNSAPVNAHPDELKALLDKYEGKLRLAERIEKRPGLKPEQRERLTNIISVLKQNIQLTKADYLAAAEREKPKTLETIIIPKTSRAFTEQLTQTRLPKLATMTSKMPSKVVIDLLIQLDYKKNLRFDGKNWISTDTKLSKSQLKANAEKIFEVIKTEKPQGKHLEQILRYLQTNPAISKIVQNDPTLRKELRAHLQEIYKERPLEYLNWQAKMLKTAELIGIDVKLTSKDGLVYVVPTESKTFGVFSRKGASAEAKNSVKIILQQMKTSVADLAGKSNKDKDEIFNNLKTLNQLFTEVGSTEWIQSAIERHHLEADVESASKIVTQAVSEFEEQVSVKGKSALPTGGSKTFYSPENYAESVLSLSQQNPEEMAALLRSYRVLKISTKDFFDKIAGLYQQNPDKYGQAVYQMLQTWLSDELSHQNEQKVLNDSSLMQLLPSTDNENMKWGELKAYVQEISQKSFSEAPGLLIESSGSYSSLVQNADFKAFSSAMLKAVVEGNTHFIVDFANQKTEMDKKLLANLKSTELMGQAWTKKNKAVASPNITAIIQNFNQYSTFGQALILSQETPENRLLAIKYLLKVAEQHIENRDYNSAMAVLTVFNANPIIRLDEVQNLDQLDPEASRILKTLKAILSDSNGYETMKAEVQSNPQASIPYIGAYLTALVKLDEQKAGNEISKGFAAGFSQIAALLKRGQTLPLQETELTGIELRKMLLATPPAADDNDLYKRSLQIKPRTPPSQ